MRRMSCRWSTRVKSGFVSTALSLSGLGALTLPGCSGMRSTLEARGEEPGLSPGQNGGSTGSLLPPGERAALLPDQSTTVDSTLPFDDLQDTSDEDEAELQRIAINPYVATQSDPFSTFAADVDTASYDLFRSTVQNLGELPAPANVRTEEFVNYFAYDYPAPTSEGDTPFAIDLAATPNFLDSPRTILRVGIQALQPIAFVKKPANLAFLVDTSGSMDEPLKLPLVKALLNDALAVLEPDDLVSIVTYGEDTGLALEPTRVSEADSIRSAIDGLEGGGGTNGSQGLLLAYSQVQANMIEDGINHVILCTDGDFNIGPSTTEELVAQIEAHRKSGITLTALGFGTEPNDEMMEQVSNKGNGIYAIIGSKAQAKRYAEERLLSTLEQVAKDVKIQVEFNPELVTAYRLIGYEDRALADDEFRDDTIDAGEVGAGHRVTALYELALTPDQLPKNVATTAGELSYSEREIATEDLVLVKVRYKEVDAPSTADALEVRKSLAADKISDPDSDLQWATAVATFAELLRGSPLANKNALSKVQTTIEAQADRDADRAEFVQLFQEARPKLEAALR
jgi:Ca-activated chloride channel homolog